MTADFFELLAPHYRQYAEGRSAYLSAIDSEVAVRLRGNSLLDVGSGDGIRAAKLARAAGLARVVLCEPSAAMRRLCPTGFPLLDLHAEELDRCREQFDNITCLWNVLGHVATREGRLRALRNLRRLLRPSGLLMLDVNNRYNGREYGWRRVAGNWWRDRRHPDRADGERTFDIEVGGRVLRGSGYVFAPGEIEALCGDSGLRVNERIAFDYRNGRRVRSPFAGQLFYVLTGIPGSRLSAPRAQHPKEVRSTAGHCF